MMKNKLLIVAALLAGQFKSPAQNIYQDKSKPVEQRVKDLISKMTLEEKATQLRYNSPAIPRLGIPIYNWWGEALHGVGRSGVATVFPQAIGLAATFDEELAQQEADVISTEGRAMYNVSVAKGYRQQYGGLSFWTPNINIFRDPRWGRGQETYGEDPYLTSRIGVAFVKGLQGDNPNYLKLAACAKHYAVHSGPERLRHEFNALPSKQDLWETYLPAFKALVDAKVEAVMCAYNRTNNEPCCGNTFLLQDVLRKKWDFKGHVVSDCWAINDFYKGHKVVSTVEQSVALALNKGVDLNCGDEYETGLMKALRDKLTTEKQVDVALSALLTTKIKLGMFDQPGSNPYDNLSVKEINSESNRALARKVAQKSIVLLKNNGVLPLKKDLQKYFVTGPNATSIEALHGNYFGINNSYSTILEGISGHIHAGSQLQYAPGTTLDRDNVNPMDWASSEAGNSNVTIMVMGITGMLEGEEGEAILSPSFGDRLDYNLPKNQIDFLRKMKKGNSRPIIAIITGGSPMNLAEVQEIADAVLLVWYPGEEGGNAVADVVFGDVTPSGKLPITFPKSLDQLPAYEDYTMKGRTYRYMTEEPLYPFGFGLSYTTFSYNKIELSNKKIKKGELVKVAATVTNTGNVDAEEVVQLYISALDMEPGLPLYSLKGFKRIALKKGETKTVEFELPAAAFTLANDAGEMIERRGQYKISVSGSLPGKRSAELGATKGLEAMLTVQ